jgi:omega-3 fatty acid desaturase (delta-15 desaturase)
MPTTYYSHFNPSAFSKSERPFVKESLIWIAVFVSLLICLGDYFGFLFLVKYYFVPYLIFGAWIAT